MTAIPEVGKTRRKLEPLRIVSSAAFVLFGILSAIIAAVTTSVRFTDLNFFLGDASFDPLRIIFTAQLILGFATPVLALAIAVLGLLSKSRWLQSILGFAVFALVFPLQWIWQLILDVPNNYGFFLWTQGYFTEDFLGWLAFVVLLIALVLSLVATLFSSKSAPQISDGEAPVLPVATSVPLSGSVATSGNLTNLPMFALIGAFVVPLAGIILGHLSLSYMKKGQLGTQNKGMATAGMFLGYAFVGLSLLIGLIFIVAMVVTSMNRGY